MNKFIGLIEKTNAECFKQSGLHTFINPFSYLKIREEGLLENFSFVYIDGISFVYVLRLFGIKVRRNSFDMTSLAPKVLAESIEKNENVYFIGSTQRAMVKFIEIVCEAFPEINLSGYRNGYFADESERENTIKEIVYIHPDVLVVGMGSPHQEKFLIDLRKAGWKGRGFTCGGFIHQTAEGLQYYPDFFDRYNLRWLYRIYDEPKLLKRYTLYYPISVCLFIFDFMRIRTGIRNNKR